MWMRILGLLLTLMVGLCRSALSAEGIVMGVYEAVSGPGQMLAKVMLRAPEAGVYSLDLRLSYPADQGRVLAVEPGPMVKGMSSAINTNQAGTILVAFAGAQAIGGNGTVLLVRLEADRPLLRLIRAQANEDAVPIVESGFWTPSLTWSGAMNAGQGIDKPMGGIHVAGVETNASELTLTLSVNHGILWVATNEVGGVAAEQISSNGTAQVILTASLQAINTALAPSSGLLYRGEAGYIGPDTLIIQVDDRGSGALGGERSVMDAASIAVHPTLQGAWRTGQFKAADLADPAKESTVWGSHADPDNDGRDNLMEYALGLCATNRADAAIGLRVEVLPVNGTHHAGLTFKRRRNDPGLRYVPEVSGDKRNWDTNAVQQHAVADGDAEFDSVTFQDLAPPTPGHPRFFRLRVIRTGD